MDKQIIWSNTFTVDRLLDMPEEGLKQELIDMGYEPEMLDTLDYEGLKDLVASDDILYDQDMRDFDAIASELANQSYDGIILMVGTAGTWQGNKEAGKAVQAEDLAYGDICRDCDYIALYNENNNVIWEASHHDGTHRMALYSIPEDLEKRYEFVKFCMYDAVEDARDFSEDEDEWYIQNIADTLDEDLINDYCDFGAVPDTCEPIKSPVNASYGVEEDLTEAKTKDPEALDFELAKIEADFENFGPDGFYAMPFTDFEKQFPEFTKTCIRKFLSELEILTPEELEDEDLLNEYWKNGDLIVSSDWPILIDGAHRLLGSRKDKGIQWSKLLAVYSHASDYLSD